LYKKGINIQSVFTRADGTSLSILLRSTIFTPVVFTLDARPGLIEAKRVTVVHKRDQVHFTS